MDYLESCAEQGIDKDKVMNVGDVVYFRRGSIQVSGFYEITHSAGPNIGFNWGASPPKYCYPIPKEIREPLNEWLNSLKYLNLD
jgi:hypothetical protein